MDEQTERARNHAAYQRLKGTLAQAYGAGRFVAIVDGQIAADAEDFTRLRERLTALGQQPSRALIVQAGIEYPEEAVIFPLGSPL